MKTTFIYALCEPGTRTVRYIGKANNSKERYTRHLSQSIKLDTHLGRWLKLLKRGGAVPEMVTLREVEGDGSDAEMRYIRLARGCGMDLVNSTDGGEGVTMTPEIREKIGLTKRGKRPPDAVLAAASAATKGVPRSPETRAKISAKLKGKRPSNATLAAASSPETCAKRSATLKGVPKSPGHRANLRGPKSPEHRANLRGPKSPEHRAANSAAHKGVPWSPKRWALLRASQALREIADQEIERALAPYTLE